MSRCSLRVLRSKDKAGSVGMVGKAATSTAGSRRVEFCGCGKKGEKGPLSS